MGTPTGGSDPELACTWCKTAIEPTNWHPVATDYTGGEVRIRPFCSHECREDWMEAAEPETQPPAQRSPDTPDDPSNPEPDSE